MNKKETERKVDQLIEEIRCLIKHETYFEVVVSALVSTLGQVIIDCHDKKQGIKTAMQIGTKIGDSVAEAYRQFEKGSGDGIYREAKTIYTE